MFKTRRSVSINRSSQDVFNYVTDPANDANWLGLTESSHWTSEGPPGVGSSYTINTYFRRPNVGANFHYDEPRLITPREAMRFQSFPDHFEVEYSSQDGRNALIGDAVPPLMAQGMAWSLEDGWGDHAAGQLRLSVGH